MTKQDSERIPNPIGDDLRPALSPARTDALWRRITDARDGVHDSRARRLLRSPAFALVAALCFMIGGLLLVRELRSPAPVAQLPSAPLTRSDGRALEAIAPLKAAASVPLSDGSELRVEKGAVLAPLDVSARSVVLHLVRGRSSFAVKPGGPRRWVVEAGAASIEVVGTRFSVERDAAGVVVQVEEGKVLVRSPALQDGVARLGAGETLRVPSRSERARGAAASDASEGGPGMEPVLVAPEPTLEPEASLAHEPGGEQPAPEDKPELKPAPGIKRASEAPRPIDADALFGIADDARMTRDYRGAIAALERVLAEHGQDPRAKLAAFTIGRIRDEHLHDLAGATAAYERALSLGLSGSLAEDCHSRLMRVLGLQVMQGRLPRARLEQAAQQYLQRYPKGRYAAEARSVLEGKRGP